MELKQIDNIELDNNTIVQVKETGNIVTLMYRQKISRGGYTKKIDKDSYIDIRTGELKPFNHNTTRADDTKSLSRSIALGRDIINTNCTDSKNIRWITLTYAENMTDTKRAYLDLQHCIQALRKHYGSFEYIAAIEPQQRGAWHFHLIMIWQQQAPYISPDKLSEAWKQGFVSCKAVDNCDNLGAYLSAYLADLEFDSEETKSDKASKRSIKGERLKLYPSGTNIFRYSKGIKRPEKIETTEEEARKKVSGATLTFQKTVQIQDEQSGFVNILSYRYYNRVRKEKQEETTP